MENEHSGVERALAGISHGLIVVQWMGIIGAVLIWLTSKDDKPYAARQALSAAIYQVFVNVAMVVVWIGWTCVYLGGIFSLVPFMEGSETPPPAFFVIVASVAIPLLITLALYAYAIVGAVACFAGKNFKYVLIGSWVEKHV